MKVLIGCEFTGTVRDAFLARGHDAISCDLLPTEVPGPHYQGPVQDLLNDPWDLLIVHPPCTHLSNSGMHRTRRGLRPEKLTRDALDFVRLLLEAPIPRIALENPVGIISTMIRKPDQIIQPHRFGHDASKKTCLWLKNLPPLQDTAPVQPRLICCGTTTKLNRWGIGVCPVCDGRNKPSLRWGNQLDSGHNVLGSAVESRWKLRSATYPGVAEAMAGQWSDFSTCAPVPHRLIV